MKGTIKKAYYLMKSVYESDISKKYHVYNNHFLLEIIHHLKRIIATPRSNTLRKLYSQNRLDESLLSTFTYHDLHYVLQYSVHLFKELSSYIYRVNLERLGKKPVVKVAFFTHSATLWSCDQLYALFESDSHFEVSIVVPGFDNGTAITIQEEYESTLSYFRQKGYNVIGVSPYSKGTWNDIGIPDIIIHLTPYYKTLPRDVNIFHVPLTSLNIYLPYGLSTVGNYWVFDTPGAQMSWKIFCETDTCKSMIHSHSVLGSTNVVPSGHPKMDVLLKPDVSYNSKDIWKISPNTSLTGVKKIIYSPHHSIYYDTIRFSTFHQNYRAMYEYAKAHQTTTSWVVKPHPLLRKNTVQYGLFKSEKEFDEYMDLWDALPNARTVRNGVYDDVFLTSDAMVMDCGSFLAEYTLMNKPLIFLRRPEQEWNECGNELMRVVYSVEGDNIEDIYSTIDDVIVSGNDYKVAERVKLLSDIFNIPGLYCEGMSASNKIYCYICESLGVSDTSFVVDS